MVCLVIFVIWQVVQTAVRGLLVNIIFCMAIFGAWKGIVNSGADEEESEAQEDGQDKSEEEPTEE